MCVYVCVRVCVCVCVCVCAGGGGGLDKTIDWKENLTDLHGRAVLHFPHQ